MAPPGTPSHPAPPHLSEEAQRYLASAPPFGDVVPPEDLDDVDGWLAYVAERDDALARMIEGFISLDDLPLERSEIEIDGVRTYVFRPEGIDASAPIYLDIHGGALTLGGGRVCELMGAAQALGRPMISWAVDYRMPPLHPYPAALDDCLAVYRRILEERPREDVFVGGVSAGGNLAPALLLRARDEGLPMPAALVLLTPEVDLTESGDSFRTHVELDHVLGSLMTINRLYANGHDLAHPYLSPLFGDLSGFPPTFLQSGTRDLFLSNTVRMHRKLRAAGVEAELHVFEAMPHGGFSGAPEDGELFGEVQAFLQRHSR